MLQEIFTDKWLDSFTKSVKDTFGQRIVCAGIQGSCARGEATEKSDIDVVVILDKF
ncbi:nucleotidyltransferase domain-containing protein, partial [bacterium]|nr:nucleotidyltransferase domain-containing protein [bacterium]